jgi:AcrR family transcriptional regulator
VPTPVKFTAEQFVDAAVRLIVAGGPSAATASAVARATGAPSGSVYHRFPKHADLLAAAWLSPLRHFHEKFLPLLTSDTDPVTAGIAAARQVVLWSAENKEAASLLARYSRSDFISDACSPGVLAEAEAADQRLHETLAGFLAKFPGADQQRILLAIVDAPLALVRRGLRSGGPHADTIELAAEVARQLLPPAHPPG